MEKSKQELLLAAQSWNTSGEYDGTEFEGRFFMSDTELDEFAVAHNLRRADGDEVIEKACDCKIVYGYESSNPNRQFGDQEIIFNGN